MKTVLLKTRSELYDNYTEKVLQYMNWMIAGYLIVYFFYLQVRLCT